MKITRTYYEQYLNDFYQCEVSADAAFDDLVYLTNASRGKHTSDTGLKAAILNGTAGSMLRRLDPIRFNVGFNDFINS